MLQIIVILAVSMILLPWIDLTITEPKVNTVFKIIFLSVTLVWLALTLSKVV